MGTSARIFAVGFMVTAIALGAARKEEPAKLTLARDVRATKSWETQVTASPPATTVSQRKPSQPGWTTRERKSPIDDSPDILITKLSNEEIEGRYGEPRRARLGIRCFEGRISIFLEFADHFMASSQYSNIGAVTHRVDSKPAQTYGWRESSDHSALMGDHDDTVIMLKEYIGGDKLTVRATPYGERPMTVSFDIRGLQEALKPLRTACKW